jgi:hypothetical protein
MVCRAGDVSLVGREAGLDMILVPSARDQGLGPLAARMLEPASARLD